MDIETLANLFESSAVMLLVIYLALFNLAITVLEIIYDCMSRKKRGWLDSLNNILILFVHIYLEKTAYGATIFVALLPFYYFMSPFEWTMTPLSWAFAILLADFSYYWMHRIEHQFRGFWAIHSVHHSSEYFNLTVAFRLSVLEGAIEWIFLVPMVLLGFNPFQVLVALIFVAQYQTWIHTKHIGKLGIIEGWLNTPSSHRVHHGANKKYIDRNYGGVLIIWDRLFGTYQSEAEEVKYGLVENINSNNPIKIMFYEVWQICREIIRTKGLLSKLRVLTARLDS